MLYITWEDKAMLQIERFRFIENILNEKSQVSVAELEKLLRISKATIYRDLNEMEALHMLRIVRGGVAKISSTIIQEQPYFEKLSTNVDEKKRIAAAAAKLVKPNDTIFLDTSTTVIQMCPSLSSIKRLQAITNDVRIASDLSGAPGIEVIVVGGVLRNGYYTLTGFMAMNNLKDLRFDTAFMSCDALSVESGCMLTNSEEAPIKKQIITNSTKVVLLCDHSKFDCNAFAKVCDLVQVSHIITGKELPADIYDRYIEAGIEVIRV